MKGYTKIASYYDRFVNRDFYKILLKYLSNKIIPIHSKRLLDLGCGTGFFSLYYASKGMNTVGIDSSSEMIKIAKSCAMKEDLNNVQFKKGDFLKVDHDGKYDYVLMFFDVINNIHDPQKISELFKKIYDGLYSDGYFFFDLLTIWGMKKMWGNDKYFEYYDDFKILWQSEWDEKNKLLNVKTKIFSEKEKITEQFTERGYETESISKKIEDSGFKILNIYPVFYFKNRPTRYIYYCKKE